MDREGKGRYRGHVLTRGAVERDHVRKFGFVDVRVVRAKSLLYIMFFNSLFPRVV